MLLGEVALDGPVYDIELVGRYAYVAAGPIGLQVVDIVDPSNPVVVASVPYGNSADEEANHLEVDGDRLVLFGTEPGAVVVDVSDPTSPTLGGNLHHPTNSYLRLNDAAVHNNYAAVSFSSTTEQYLYFFSLDDPSSPVSTGTFHTTSYLGSTEPTGVEWVGDIVYVVGFGYGIWVVDATDPSNPTEINWVYWFSQGNRRLEVQNNLLIGVVTPSWNWYYGSLEYWDISTPTNPVRLGFGAGPRAVNLDIEGAYVYVANHSGGLQIVDLSNPASPSVVFESDGWGSITDLAVTGAYGLTTNERDGVASFDFSDGSTIVERDRLLGTEDLVVARARGANAYVSSNYNFFVVDASDPDGLLQIGSCPTGAEGDLALMDSLGAGPSDEDVVVFDLSDPATPAELGTCDGPTGSGFNAHAREVAVAFDHVYSTIEVYDYPPVPWRFQVCDISDPASPSVVSSTTLGPDPADVMVKNQHLLMATESGLQTYDLTAAAVPAADGWLTLGSGVDQLGSLFDTVFATVADSQNGLLTIDASDLSAPTFVCAIPTAGKPMSVSVSGGKIFVALKDAGIQVFHYPELVFADDFEVGREHHWSAVVQ